MKLVMFCVVATLLLYKAASKLIAKYYFLRLVRHRPKNRTQKALAVRGSQSTEANEMPVEFAG